MVVLTSFLIGFALFQGGFIDSTILEGTFLSGLVSASSFDAEDTREIGYEFLDDGSVVHIWNNATISDYFFNKSSGIQLTNHYEDYWTRNIFCIGYYNNGEWNKIACADELTGFQKSIETDNETYVNATLWKDISYGAYDLRFGVQYHLGLNDENLSITIYGKNIGIDIPFDLGFAWKVTDWDIPPDKNDYLQINDTHYPISLTNYSLTFKNLDESYFKGYDNFQYLRVDWNENLNYFVKMYGNENPDDFYVALLINVGHFNPQQEKSTTFQWIDAITPSNYAGVSGHLATETTWSHNIPCGDDMVLLVGLAVDSEAGPVANTVTYNEVSLSRLVTISAQTNQLAMDVWNLTAPDCGDAYDVVVDYRLGTSEEVVGISVVYDNVAYIKESSLQQFDSDEESNTLLGVTTTSADEIVVDMVAIDTIDTIAIDGGDNQVRIGSFSEGAVLIASSYAYDSDGNTTIGWTWDGDEVTHAAVALIPSDKINPDINITYPINNTEHANTLLDVNYTASDNVALDSCWWSNDTYSVNHSLTDCGTNITDITWSAGQHNVTVWARDTTGNENSSTVTFTIDTIYPKFSNYWDDNASLEGAGVGNFNATVINTNGTVLLEIDGENTTATNLTSNIYNVSYNFTEDGVYSYRWHSWGNGSSENYNVSEEQSYTVNISYGWLNVSISKPDNNSEWETGNENLIIDITITCLGGAGATCGTVSALARYNESSANPDTAINITEGGLPFYITKTWYQTLDETVFNPASTDYISITTIDNDSVAIAYQDNSAGSNGTLVVYNINGTVELDETVFNPASTDYISITTIDNDSIAISYSDFSAASNGTFVVYNINGTVELDETVFNPASTDYTSITTIDNDSIAISYKDDGAASNGTFVVYNINGTVELDETVFNPASTDYTSITTIDNDSVAISYRDDGALYNGTFVVYNINGTVELDETVFNPAITFETSITTIDNDSIAISYSDFSAASNGTFVVYNINGTVELDETVFNPAETYYTSITTIDNDSIAISYRDDGAGNKGTFVVYNIDGTVELDETVFNPAITFYISIITIDNNSVAISYRDDGAENNGTFVVYSLISENPEISSEILGESSLETLEQGEQWNVSWTLNVTSTSTESYLIDVLFNSSYGNSLVPDNDTEDRTVLLNPSGADGTPPNINITFPINNTEYANTLLDVNYTVSDTGTLESFWWSNDSMTVNHSLGTAGSPLNITNITWSLGNHNVTVWANDTSGNENHSIVTFNITAPADTCTCAGLNEDWEIDHADACTITDNCDLGTGTLSFTGSGTTQCDAEIKTTNLGEPGSSGILEILDDCVIYIS
jgi:hypothetical protein